MDTILLNILGVIAIILTIITVRIKKSKGFIVPALTFGIYFGVMFIGFIIVKYIILLI